MHMPSRWVRRILVLTLLLAAGTGAAKRLATPGGPADGFIPPIGGDTWPPVPVKDVRTV